MPGGHKNERRRQVWERVSVAQAERWAYRDKHNLEISEAVENWYVGRECCHGHLPADPSLTCGCWAEDRKRASDISFWPGLTVREAEALRHDIQNLSKTLERHHEEFHEAIRTLTDVLQHLDKNVYAVGLQVSKAGDNGR